MSILTATNVGQSFGAFDVFAGVTVSIPNDGKIGLVGPNGIGKTTLLLILAGLAQPVSGQVHIARGRRLGYLRQEAVEAFAEHDNTVYQEMLGVFAHLQEQQRRLHEMEEAMANGAVETRRSASLLDEYGAAQEAFVHAGGYDYEVRIKQTLDGLGFGASDWGMPLNHLSGGQKTRVLLARLLLEKPDLLIMDEPTNHLDVEAIEWLETTLRNWDGAFLIVSHDRYFLDRTVNTIWEMSRSGMEVYRGNYSAYLIQRQDRWEQHMQIFEREKARLDKEMVFIKANIPDGALDMARGKLKRLTREVMAIEQLGVMALQNKSWSEIASMMESRENPWGVAEAEQRVKALKPPARPPQLKVHLKPEHRSGNIVLRTRDLRIGYPGKPLFNAGDIELWYQERAALIGPNGAGKTTFLRTILEQLEPLAGQVRLGASLRVGYFAQAHDALNSNNSVLDEILEHFVRQGKERSVSKARNYLAQYLFRGDDIYKLVSMLSGGERARLALAILALEGANLLLLDEPTNHLDIPAQEVLQSVLEQFDGTILLVSHDRYLVDRLATHIWDLRDGHLRVFKGSYQEFLADRERRMERAKQDAAKHRSEFKQQTSDARRAENEAKKRAQTVAQIEAQIQHAENSMAQLTHDLQLAGQNGAFDKIQRLSAEYAAHQGKLEHLLAEWERVTTE
ncbi:MAG: ATP-binding cassette domain-containing protein [Chloroflexi bacterium]|nr:ATP-binding cassette domain-containing protein [Chloroflexota bacterium]